MLSRVLPALTAVPPVPVPGPAQYELAEWWDILNAFAQTFGAIGTAGALLIAALSYRRQVNERRRDLASRVTLQVHSGEKLQFTITNRGELPVSDVRFMEALHPSIYERWEARERAALGVVMAGRRVLVPVPRRDGLPARSVGHVEPEETVTAVLPDVRPRDFQKAVAMTGLYFVDGHGRSWLRTTSGGLFPAEKAARLRWKRVTSMRQARKKQVKSLDVV